MELIESIFLTALAYMAFPVIRLMMNNGKFEKKQAHKIALWNSIICGLVFCVVAAEADITWNAFPAVLYYWINRMILTDKAKERNSASKEDNPKTDTDSVSMLLQESDTDDIPTFTETTDEKRIDELRILSDFLYEQEQKKKANRTKLILALLCGAACLIILLMIGSGNLIKSDEPSRQGATHQLVNGKLVPIEPTEEHNIIPQTKYEKSTDGEFAVLVVICLLLGVILAVCIIAFCDLIPNNRKESETLEEIRNRIKEIENSDPR